jgi:hypothetical protein
MRATTIRWGAAGIGCLAATAIAAAPIGASAAAGHHTHAAKHRHPNGFFVGDRNGNDQKVENYGTPSALVRDANGVEHLVTTKPSKNDPAKGQIVYLTRESDKGGWKAHAIAKPMNLAGSVQVEAHLSYGGRRVFAVFYGCDGVYVTDAPIGASRLPVPTKIMPLDTCTNPPASTDNLPVAKAGSLVTYGRTIGVLLPDLAIGGVQALYTGTPGQQQPFTAGTPLPTADGFKPEQIAIDPIYGGIVVVGEGVADNNQGIFAVTQDRFDQNWSDPVEIASLQSATKDYAIDAVADYNHHIYVGLSKPGRHVSHRLFLVRGQPSGQWLGTIKVPHTTGDDHNLRLLVNTATHHLHAVWTRIIPNHKKSPKSGIMHEAQNANGWLKPTYVSHWYRDVPTQITITTAGHPYVGYNQR